MVIYNIELTEEEDLALSYAAADQKTWIYNAAQHRCEVAIDEIVEIAVKQCFANNIQIPTSKSDVVKLAFEMGWVKSAEQINKEMESQTLPA